jgi:hypothetical protein
MDSMIEHVNTKSISDPLLNLAVGGEAFRLGKTETELLKLVGGESRSFACRNVDIKQRRDATGGVMSKPTRDGIAAHSKESGKLGAVGGLGACNEKEHMEALTLAWVMLFEKERLEFVGRLDNRGHGSIHGKVLVPHWSTPGYTTYAQIATLIGIICPLQHNHH